MMTKTVRGTITHVMDKDNRPTPTKRQVWQSPRDKQEQSLSELDEKKVRVTQS